MVAVKEFKRIAECMLKKMPYTAGAISEVRLQRGHRTKGGVKFGQCAHLKNRDVQAILKSPIEVWMEELVSGGRIES